MGISKVYRGYVIEDVNGQWYIRNAPNYLNGFPFNPGPHGGWTIATHQVDKLHDYLARNESSNRQKDMDKGKYVPQQPQQEYRRSSSETDGGDAILGFIMVCLFIFGWYIALKG